MWLSSTTTYVFGLLFEEDQEIRILNDLVAELNAPPKKSTFDHQKSLKKFVFITNHLKIEKV